MTRLNGYADRMTALLYRMMMAIVTSEGLYLAVMVLFNGVLNTDIFLNDQHIISPLRDYVIMPWSGLMLGVYLMRPKARGGLDIRVLILLVIWLAVPFIMRFGTEYFTMNSVYGYSICFFVFYASVCERDAVMRERQLDIACAGVGLIAIVLGAALLYCAWTGKVFCSYWDTQHFGVVNGQLQHATHYNSTAMIALSCLLMCLVGLCRCGKKPYALFYLTGMVIMTLVVILTQSRTARYAMLAVFALGTWNGLAEYLPVRKALLRQMAALACAGVVLVGGYKLCGTITNMALAHYAGQTPQLLEAMLPSAIAEGTEAAAEMAQPLEARSQKVDATFSDRTNIWKNVFNNWKENPRHMLIGNGAGRTKWLVSENTIHEAAGFVDVHNAYLHFATEFGLIGFVLLAAFLLHFAPSLLYVFFAHGTRRMPGGCALCMLVLAVLATGMMESSPLQTLTPMNMVLFFALAQLAGAGCDMKKNG